MPLTIKIAEDNAKATPNVKGIVYGAPGSGKSTLLASLPNVLFLDLEIEHSTRFFKQNGLGKIPVATISSWADLQSAVAELRTSKYDSIVVDSLTACAEYMKEALKKENPKNFLDNGNPTLPAYGIMKTRIDNMIRAYCMLDKNVFFTAHSTTKTSGSEDKPVVTHYPLLVSKDTDKALSKPYLDIVAFIKKPGMLTMKSSDEAYCKDSLGFWSRQPSAWITSDKCTMPEILKPYQ